MQCEAESLISVTAIFAQLLQFKLGSNTIYYEDYKNFSNETFNLLESCKMLMTKICFKMFLKLNQGTEIPDTDTDSLCNRANNSLFISCEANQNQKNFWKYYSWSSIAKSNEIISCIQRKNYLHSTNYLYIQQNNYFDSTNYFCIQQNNYFDSTNYLYIQRSKYFDSTNYLHIQQNNYFNWTNYLYNQGNNITIFIKRIIYIFNERIVFFQRIFYIFNVRTIFIQQIIYKINQLFIYSTVN